MAGMREQSTDQTLGQDRQPACARLAPCGAPSISDTASTCTTISNISLRTRNARIRTSPTCSSSPRPRRRRRVPLHQLLLGHFTQGLIPTSSQFHSSLQSPRPAMARQRERIRKKPGFAAESGSFKISFSKPLIERKWCQVWKLRIENRSFSSCYTSCPPPTAADNILSSPAFLSSITRSPCVNITSNKSLEMPEIKLCTSSWR